MAEDKKTVVVNASTAITTVLELNQDPSVSIKFDIENFLDIDEKVVAELRPDVQKEYWLAFGRKKPYRDNAEIQVLGMLGNTAGRRLSVINKGTKPGEHRCWKRPDELEEALFQGYRRLRGWKKPDKQAEFGYRPDTEADGDLLVLNNSDKNGNVFTELIGMVIDKQRFENHLKAVAKLSSERYTQPGDRVREVAEEVNSGLRSGRNGYVKVVDDSIEGTEEVVNIYPSN